MLTRVCEIYIIFHDFLNNDFKRQVMFFCIYIYFYVPNEKNVGTRFGTGTKIFEASFQPRNEAHSIFEASFHIVAYGPDGIPPRLHKEAATEITPSLTKLMNASL